MPRQRQRITIAKKMGESKKWHAALRRREKKGFCKCAGGRDIAMCVAENSCTKPRFQAAPKNGVGLESHSRAACISSAL